MDEPRQILTVREVAQELRCSASHVHNVIKGKVKNVSPLPAIRMGRLKLVLRKSLEEWKRTNEAGSVDAMISVPKTDAARRMKEEMHA